MTARGRWMALPALLGLFFGVLQGNSELSLLSMSVLIWLAAEWALPSGVTGPRDFIPLAREAATRRADDISDTRMAHRFEAGRVGGW